MYATNSFIGNNPFIFVKAINCRHTFTPTSESIRISISGTSRFALTNLSLDRDNVDAAINKISNSDLEEGKIKKAINDHMHIFYLIDGVQGGLAGREYYKWSPETRQYLIDVSSKYKSVTIWSPNGEWLDAHSFDADHPELIKNQVNSETESLDPID